MSQILLISDRQSNVKCAVERHNNSKCILKERSNSTRGNSLESGIVDRKRFLL